MNVQSAGQTIHHTTFRAMNTDIDAVWLSEAAITGVEEDIRGWFRYAEERFSRFRPDSELSRLNRLGGGLALISDSMLEVLSLAEAYRSRTSGLFQPFIASALRRLGYGASFEQVRLRQEPWRIDGNGPEALPGNPAKPCVRLDPVMKSVLLPYGHELDLGGIVKSWTVRRLAGWLEESRGIGRGMINAGGDLFIWGNGQSLVPSWRVWIQDPWHMSENIGYTDMVRGAAATSGIMGRSWHTDRGVKHHLIDPVTMDSSASGVIQCTVFGEDPVTCEVWSKAICIAGAEEGLRLLREREPGYEALLFHTDGTSAEARRNLNKSRGEMHGILDG